MQNSRLTRKFTPTNGPLTKISEVRKGMTGLKVRARVVRKWDDKLSMYRPHAMALLDDGSGQIRLNLWRGQVAQVEVGDILSLKDAFARGRKGTVELSTWEEELEVKEGRRVSVPRTPELPPPPDKNRKDWAFP